MSKHYLVIGAAGHAQEVAWSVREQHRVLGEAIELTFFDDRVPPGPLASGLGSVAGPLDMISEFAAAEGAELVLGVGLPRVKVSVVARLSQHGLRWATVVHPLAVLGANVSLGEGSYIAAGAILTVNVTVGRFVTINMHCQVAHEDVLGDFVTLHSDVHLSGDVQIADGCEVGTGAIAIPGVRIGDWAVVGAGSVVVESLAGNATYAGVPARQLAKKISMPRAEVSR